MLVNNVLRLFYRSAKFLHETTQLFYYCLKTKGFYFRIIIIH